MAVAVGALGAWLGFERADPIVGLIISVAILAVLRGAARQIFQRLMDAVDPAVVDAIEHDAGHVAGVHDVPAVQARSIGHRLAASVTIVVDDHLSVRQGHDVAEAVRHELLHSVRHLDDVDVHVDPADHDGLDAHAAVHHHQH